MPTLDDSNYLTRRASFDDKIRGMRSMAQAETAQVARKLIDSLDSSSDLDLSELMISRNRDDLLLSAPGPYGPYGNYPPPPPGPYGPYGPYGL